MCVFWATDDGTLLFVRELVSLLQSRETAVYLISGGFRRLIEPAAQHLNIPVENIFANRLLFENGEGG